MNERENIRFRLMKNNLTSTWLINMLAKRGVETDRATMSAALAGTRKGPKVDTILAESVSVLDWYGGSRLAVSAMTESVFVPEVRGQAKALSLLVAQSVREFFKDEDHRKEFEAWYEQKYGQKYQWKPVKWRT